MMGQKRYREALNNYNLALDVVRTRLTEEDAELAQLYGGMALAHHLLGDLIKARELYLKAEKIYRAAYVNMGGEDADEETEHIRRSYIQALKRLLEYHLMAAEEAGATSEVEEIKNRMKSLP